jgi:hypothetical protein
MAKVLVAVDGSQHGTDALLWAAQQLWKPDMQLDVVTGEYAALGWLLQTLHDHDIHPLIFYNCFKCKCVQLMSQSSAGTAHDGP